MDSRLAGTALRIWFAAAMIGCLLLVTARPTSADDTAKAEEEQAAPDVSKVPPDILKALNARFPKAEIQKWTQETEDSVVIFDFEFTQEGRKFEADVRADGSIHNWEKAIAAKELPEAVRKAVEAKYPKSSLQEIMQIHTVHDGKDVLEGYEVLLTSADEKQVEVTLAPEGKILEDSGSDE